MSTGPCRRFPVLLLVTVTLFLVAAAPLHGAHTGPLVSPTAFPGNLPGDGLAVCEAILGTDPQQEIIGIKVDPTGPFSDGHVSVSISSDGRFLAWQTSGATMLAVLVKGGPNYNVYDYFSANVTSDHDNGLRSPTMTNGRIPEISHYNLCYMLAPEGTGCTPGYWRNHADRWLGVSPADDFDTTFGVDLFSPDVTLGWAIWATGGGINALARHATAGLLNAYGGVPNGDGTTVQYLYSVAQVIQLVQDAEASGLFESVKDLFEAANEAGCPLSGTSAVPVVP